MPVKSVGLSSIYEAISSFTPSISDILFTLAALSLAAFSLAVSVSELAGGVLTGTAVTGGLDVSEDEAALFAAISSAKS